MPTRIKRRRQWEQQQMTYADIIIGVVAAVSATATAVESNAAAQRQAEAASNLANYNAKVDVANASQQAMDANANIQKKRQEDATYQSSQRAALAASGVLSDSGSPMTLQATTAGRQEQDIQTYWTQVQEQESSEFAAAQVGIYQGAEEASTFHLEGDADIFQGIGSIAGSKTTTTALTALGT